MTYPTEKQAIEALGRFVQEHPGLLCITGAGCSAPSGIPVYRDNNGNWQRTTPIQHQDFIRSPRTRQRYWSRSFRGWPLMSEAIPNGAHGGLQQLEAYGLISMLVTQNVDGLHQKAGHQQVVDLHGRLDRVMCLQCQSTEDRDAFQLRIAIANPELDRQKLDSENIAPDGDADIAEDKINQLDIPNCLVCQGDLMPDVVFYGGHVPRTRVETVMAQLDASPAVLVVGSSMMVYSAYRFCKRARQIGVPIALINKGKTRIDDMVDLKISADCVLTMKDLLKNVVNWIE